MNPTNHRERHVLRVVGLVQGVGFRPHVHALATRLGLTGSVQNRTGDVWIEIEGDPRTLAEFTVQLERTPPPLAHIKSLERTRVPPQHDASFTIHASLGDATHPGEIPPDIATCPACLRELRDPNDRRHGHPFINCTDCGPRLTIIKNLPYDRERTTMAGFAMCPRCRAEYDDPSNRRFHAQPVACPDCGPTLRLTDNHGTTLAGDPIPELARRLAAGAIATIKGIGGYHLACDATDEQTVQRLRILKHRDEKPFAIMVRDLTAAESLAHLDDAARSSLTAPARPILLAPRRDSTSIAASVAPDTDLLGLLFPYTPIHHQLLALTGPLVMTSGNLSDEPIVHLDDEAITKLGTIADVFLVHDRPIVAACEDSVVRFAADGPILLRRARGHAPLSEPLPIPLRVPTLAVGGQLKSVFALGRGATATLSPHLGDLDAAPAHAAFLIMVERFEQLLRIHPACIVHDLHPDYAPTRYALERAASDGVPLLAVQHHHAHMAACMAEHGLREPVIGVTFDGLGYGDDGTLWGGEFLVGDLATVRRAAHLAPIGMPGGGAALREPRRMAIAWLLAAGVDLHDNPFSRGLPRPFLALIEQLITRKINTPTTTSIGRLFDAVAALNGVCNHTSFEGQAAMRLESLAAQSPDELGYPVDLVHSSDTLVLDPRPLIRAVVADRTAGIAPTRIARRFHTALVDAVVATCTVLREATGLTRVVLSGGVFNNAILACETPAALARAGFTAHRHRRIPPGDGGLALGQLAVAAARQAR